MDKVVGQDAAAYRPRFQGVSKSVSKNQQLMFTGFFHSLAPAIWTLIEAFLRYHFVTDHVAMMLLPHDDLEIIQQ